jgi:hypothetical protein
MESNNSISSFFHYDMTSTSVFSHNKPSDLGMTMILLAEGIIGVAAVVITAVVLRGKQGAKSVRV